MRSIELFAGAGGLAIGASLAGFKPEAVIEWDRWACDTIRENKARKFAIVKRWPLYEGDVRGFNFDKLASGLDLVAGGPPCQPFSMGGKHRAFEDNRDMFPTTVDVVRSLQPRAFIFENVKGLTRAAFANYFQYVQLQLAFPEIMRKAKESWEGHLSRLEREKTSGRRHGLTYDVVARVLNAANYGVPQKRERVFIVGFREDQGLEWSFPNETHSAESLAYDQWKTGEYWERHKVAKSARPNAPHPLTHKKQPSFENLLLPWRTVRDALDGLPEPNKSESVKFLNHKFQPGARTYKGHTGSPLDLPAKTLKAGDHGVPGGENMMVRPDGSVRYFTVREAARLQTFPDEYVFHGAWSETMRQLGNAVPVMLGRIIASSVADKLKVVAGAKRQTKATARKRLH